MKKFERDQLLIYSIILLSLFSNSIVGSIISILTLIKLSKRKDIDSSLKKSAYILVVMEFIRLSLSFFRNIELNFYFSYMLFTVNLIRVVFRVRIVRLLFTFIYEKYHEMLTEKRKKGLVLSFSFIVMTDIIYLFIKLLIFINAINEVRMITTILRLLSSFIGSIITLGTLLILKIYSVINLLLINKSIFGGFE